METAAAMGFPRDSISVALLAFARFFSLPPGLLGNLRRELLNSLKTSLENSSAGSGQGKAVPSGREKASLEASALAVTTALDKGVSLDTEAHIHYTRFLVPPETSKNQKDDNDHSSGTAGGRQKKDDDDTEEMPEAEKIKAIAEAESQKDSLLDFLNSLPGKNGQYWAVFPFGIKVNGTELKVFIRILKREDLFQGEGSFVIADISGPRRQWRCFLKEKDGQVLADLRVYPDLSKRTLALLKKEAERFLREASDSAPGFGGFGEILVKNRDESMSWMEELCAESLPSINKEV